MARYLFRHVDPIVMPAVDAPQASAGTRNVALNRPSDVLGDPATLRNLTVNGNVGPVSLPPGACDSITINGGATLRGPISPARLIINGNGTLIEAP